MNPRVLVTGAAGFIGHACAKEFLRRGWDVTATVYRREPEGLAAAKCIRVSLTAPAALAALFDAEDAFDVVLNCAGLASDVARRSRLMEANYHAAANLAQCMAPRGTARLVHISTTDVYGIRDFADADESTPLEDNLRNGYARSKIMAERAIPEALPRERYIFLRPGAVCGPGDATILPRVLAFMRTSPWIVHFGPWRGRNRWPLVHVTNVARAAFLAATCDEAAGQAYNVVDPHVTSVEEYYRWVLRTFLPHKAGIRSVTVPMGVARVFGWASSALSRALDLTHPLMDPSLYALHSLASNLDFSSRKLQELFARHGETFVSSFDGGPAA